MNILEHPMNELARTFHNTFPNIVVRKTFGELAKLGTPEQRAEAVRVAAHRMVCVLMKHFTVRNLAAEQPAFNDFRELMMLWHSRLKVDRHFANAAGWNTVKTDYRHPTGLIGEEEERIWYMALLLCTNDVVAVGPKVLALLPDIIGPRDPTFPQIMADEAVSFFVEALEAQQAVTA